MILFDYLAQLLTLMACALIFWRVEPALNRCHVLHTSLLINVAFYLLTVGALVLGGSVLIGVVPSWSTTLLAGGIAMLLLCERRVRVFIRASRPKRQEVL